MEIFDAIIETDSLILRPFTLEDVDEYYHINLDPEVTRYTNDGGVKTKDEIYNTIKDNVLGDYAKHGYGRFAVELKSNNEIIGFSGLKYLPEYKEVDLGYRFAQKYWGNGIATEAGLASINYGFNTLHLKKIIGLVLPENGASIRVLTKLGFEFEKQLMEEKVVIKQYTLQNTNTGNP